MGCRIIQPPSPQNKVTTSKYFKAVGHLNYGYEPGVFVPLRNGKILAFGGSIVEETRPAQVRVAQNGKRYGHNQGIVELFDPDTGKTTVMTEMPFWFTAFHAPTIQQMHAIELADGRVFLVGKFEDQRLDSEKSKQCGQIGEEQWQLLPFYSKTKPDMQLRSITPCTEPNLFGLIYDLKKNSFELVHTTSDIPPRFLVTMNLLPDGRVLIIGGGVSFIQDKYQYSSWEEFPETRVLVFNPKNGTLSVAGHIKHARYGHQAVNVEDTKFMLFGGWGISDAETNKTICTQVDEVGKCTNKTRLARTLEVELYDSNKQASKVVGHILSERFDFSAIPLSKEKIFITGGSSSSSLSLGHDAAELYDIKLGKSVYVGKKKTPKELKNSSQPAAPYYFLGEGIWFKAVLKQDLLLSAGADIAFLYSWRDLVKKPVLLKHSVPENLAIPRLDHQIVKTKDDRVFLMGGLTNDFFDGKHVMNEHYAYVIEEFIYPKKVLLKK